MSAAEEAFVKAWAVVAPDGHDCTREYVFHPERKWRFDFAFPSLKVAIEIDGRGRHQTVVGARNDCEKHNEAVRLGWRVIRFPATDAKLASDWARTVLLILIEAASVVQQKRSA